MNVIGARFGRSPGYLSVVFIGSPVRVSGIIFHVSRFSFHVSAFTFHVSRFIPYPSASPATGTYAIPSSLSSSRSLGLAACRWAALSAQSQSISSNRALRGAQ